ncbi:hypothetical protein CCR75_009258 [Bremia lactucae]|uniref:tRNA pseudouridine(55) synthase n=1 Tax=Bremia lactucae TaxID=4779 RepID=A0A976FK89_BRELC|nr:hypothetical protein CCR75_009258 [Bremia lactucae]
MDGCMDLTNKLRDGLLLPDVLQVVLGLGICVRCCLRFCGIQESYFYACLSEEKIAEAFYKFANLIEVEPRDAACCTCCVGVLNEAVHEKILADVQQLADKSDYDVKSFSLNIKLPSVVLLREYSLLEFLRVKVDNFPHGMPFPLKDSLKFLLAPSVSRILKNSECSVKSEFIVLIDIKHDEAADEVRQIPAIQQLAGNRKRARGPPPVFDGFGSVSRALAVLTEIPESIKCPPTRLRTKPDAVVKLEREPVYMQGRYLKFQRGLSQTPWILDGKRIGDSSVEECIGSVALSFFGGSGYKFHTAGREDVDVRMLGNGRPFILEILDAKKAFLNQCDYDQIQQAVNDANDGAVEILQVKSSTRDYFTGLQTGADSKKKTYCCVVWSKNNLTKDSIKSIDSIQDLTIQQQTPVRVLHRRTLMTRPKVIHAAKCEVLNKHYMLLRLVTSAGTYVKEFVHGDRGRTNPNVSSLLGCDADIIQLDVESLIDAP